MEYENVTEEVLLCIESIFWVTLSYFVGSFILLIPVWKLQAMETPTIM
jgi:hypothetical protein